MWVEYKMFYYRPYKKINASYNRKSFSLFERHTKWNEKLFPFVWALYVGIWIWRSYTKNSITTWMTVGVGVGGNPYDFHFCNVRTLYIFLQDIREYHCVALLKHNHSHTIVRHYTLTQTMCRLTMARLEWVQRSSSNSTSMLLDTIRYIRNAVMLRIR